MSTHVLTRWLTRAALFAVLATAGPATAAAQQFHAPPKPARPHVTMPYGRAGVSPSSRVLAFAAVSESEPNDSIPIADPVALGDTVSGLIDPVGDIDFYAFDLPAGTQLVLDVDASQFGSNLDPIIALFDVDGVTQLAFSDDWDGLDSHIEFPIPAAGRYYAGIMDYGADGGAGHFYALKIVAFVPLPPGPGDSTRLFAQGLSYPMGMTAALNGGLFVADPGSGTIARIGAGGALSTLADLPEAWDVAVDGFSDLLVAAGDSGILRVTLGGTVTRFAPGWSAMAVTVDAAGDVWAGGVAGGTIEVRHYDARGASKGTIDVGVMGGMSDLAFSPAGDLYASNDYDGVFRIAADGPVRVITAEPYLEGLAFDQDGYLYVANGYLGSVALYSPSFQPVSTPFARTNLGGPISLAFGRTAAGAMTSRLFAANAGYNLAPPFAGGIVEMNPAGMRAPGFRVGVTRPVVPLADVADAFLGKPGAVSAEVEEFLDLQGNGNGRLDVADFRAYLRTINQPVISAGRAKP